MSYTFGFATSDDISWTESGTAWGTNGQSGLICGWFFPTTLTATLCLWSVGTVHRCEIATTTSEIQLVIDRVTTDVVYSTSGLGLAVNQWTFIAVLQSWANAATVPAVRVWKSNGSDVPQLVTVNNTTVGAGNQSTSTAPTIGNLGTAGLVAFQGDIGRFDFVCSTVSGSLVRNAAGTISADEEFQIWTQYVVPIWARSFPTFLGSGTNANNGITHVSVDLDDISANFFGSGTLYGRRIRNGGTIITQGQAMTGTGVSTSSNRAPNKTIRPVEWPDRLMRG